jgi:hypothetical protein
MLRLCCERHPDQQDIDQAGDQGELQKYFSYATNLFTYGASILGEGGGISRSPLKPVTGLSRFVTALAVLATRLLLSMTTIPLETWRQRWKRRRYDILSLQKLGDRGGNLAISSLRRYIALHGGQ